MEIGQQIKALRQRRGITQEAMAQHLGVTPQAVSKWERDVSTPDIALLPDISAYFGVTIDEIFALSDETRMDRIQNMLWDVRFLNPTEVENERQFLLEKARREPDNQEPCRLLAQLELHLAQEHRTRAQTHALEVIARAPSEPYVGFMYLAEAMGGVHYDPRFNLHNELIAIYEDFLEKHPACSDAYQWLIGQLVADHRLEEAQRYCDEMARLDTGYVLTVQQIRIALARQDLAAARALWTKMAQENPDNFTVWQWVGDFQTQAGLYEEAQASYRRSIALLEKPRYVDPVCALALCCERDGDIAGALAARQLELEISREDWHDTTGESIEAIRREIERLKARVN